MLPPAQNRDEINRHALSTEERTAATILMSLLAFGAVFFYIANSRLHVRREQLIEAAVYVVCFMGAIALVAHYLLTYSEKWHKSFPRVPACISPHKDRRHVQKAFAQNAIVLGYEGKEPCYWSDDVRRMQAILLGSSGSGKTTVLRNIIVQDIQRQVGDSSAPHHIPIIIVDGKGDGEFLKSLLFPIAAAGRLQDLRVLDPARPDISVRYNPLHIGPENTYEERATLTFESFDLKNDFFKGHQANYFSDLVRVLANTGKQINIYDVLVVALDEHILHDQIKEAERRVAALAGMTRQAKLNFDMSAKNLLQSLQDRERVTKIQGLINELMVFLDDKLSIITGAYDSLLTFDEVIDRELILFVSLNANRNPRADTALGRMLLQDLQLMVGKRYGSGRNFLRDGSPMVSVILDEFAPFAYPNFAQILQTARGSNIAFLFSLQSVPQLESVNRHFRANVTSAPNTILLMKTSNQETAQYFQEAVSETSVDRLTERVHRRGLFSNKFDRDGVGNSTPIKEPRVADEHIKHLPIGQMHALMTDLRLGAPRYLQLHARRESDCRPEFFEPRIYPNIAPAVPCVHGANLRFKDSAAMQRARMNLRKSQGIAL